MRNTYSLNEGWIFKKRDFSLEKITSKSVSEERINLPHTWNNEVNNSREEFSYQRTITLSENHRDDNLYLEFLGANSVCKVYLNDLIVGEHRGGYSAFRFDITELFDWDKENVVTVFVDNSQTKDVSPLNGDFTIYGGLYRPVNLICVDKDHFSLDFWGTDGIIIRSEVKEDKSGVVNLEVHTVCASDAVVNITILDEGNRIIYSETTPSDQKNVVIELDEPNLWEGQESPYLYTLEATLQKNGTAVDQIKKTFGFRSCSLTPDRGFFLNDKHLRINGVAKHQDFEDVGNAVRNEHIEKDFEIIREIGANAIRLSHYQHSQSVYDLCDKEGYVVWAEIPMMSLPDREGVLENAADQLTELILQNCHHPSICFWGIQNEIAMDGESIAMYQSVNTLNDRVRELLPTALTASANMNEVKNNSPLNFITDMMGYNLYFGWYYDSMHDLNDWIENFHTENPQVSLGISEYGADSNLAFHSDTPKVKDYSEEFQAVYHEQTYPIIKAKPYMWGSFVWNLFDFGSSVRNEGGTKGKNCKGLVTFDRNTKKDAFYYYKANWSAEPFIHICEKRFVNRDKDTIDIKVYSNLKQVSLMINETALGTVAGETVFSFENVRLQPGENKVRAYSDSCEDSAIFNKVDAPDQSYIFVDPNPEINVKNWFTQERGEVDLFPSNAYSVLDTLGTLMENEEAWNVVKESAPDIAERSVPGAPVTLLWVANKMKNYFSEEAVKEINNKLIKITKS